MANTSWLFVIFGAQGMGLLPAALGIGSHGTRWRLLRYLLPLCPAPVAWRLSQLAPASPKLTMSPPPLPQWGIKLTHLHPQD